MNQIPQPKILYPNIYSQIPGQQIQSQFPPQVQLQHQISQISQNNMTPTINSNNNEQSKFIYLKK